MIIKSKKIIAVLTLSILAIFTFVSCSEKQVASTDDCGTVRMGDFDWDSANIHAAISSFILEKGYGCTVEITKGSTTPIMAAHYDKQLDVLVEVWYDNIIDNYKPHEEAGTIFNAGINTPASEQAFWVDATTAAKYNLKSVEDMKNPEVAALFNDPENPGMGRMYSCISGWTCYTINLVKQKEYGLDEFYTNYDPGTSGALDAAIAGAFAKGNPIFTYYWTPTGLMGKVDMVRLAEPAWTEKCWGDMSAVVESIKADGPDAYVASCACEYRDMALTKSMLTEWADAHPAESDFIKAYTLSTPTVNKLLAEYTDPNTGGDMEATARMFLSEYSEWKSMVPADVAKKISAAL
jgi:glycine betaine/proline transport system substrate-binding protein